MMRADSTAHSTVEFSTEAGRALPDTLYGITTELVTDLTALSTAVERHEQTATVRIVFQDNTPASYYQAAVADLRQHSYVMGEISDSTALANQTIAEYRARTTEYITTFGDSVDIYEIGNELNGEWVGANPDEINDKVQAAYDVVKKDFASLDLKTAITLNYWPTTNYYALAWEDTLTYAQGMPQEIRDGTDYLLLSFYEMAGDPQVRPTNQDFIDIFSSLMPLFPNAKVGMGEVGTNDADHDRAEQIRIANRYYGMHDGVKAGLGSRYVGGYFWWTYYQNCVPWNKIDSFWPTIDNNMSMF
jgi:hypothetical protein